MNETNYKLTNSGIYLPKDASDFDSPWATRILSADKFYKEWEGKFKCKLLEEYYEGFQWKQRRDYPTTNYNPYTINLVYSTVKIKLAGLLFQRPKFLVSPNPGNSQWNLDFAVQSAQLKEDVLNSIVSNRNINFKKNVKLAAQDSFFRFGLLEIGYANDWRNPQKVDPQLKSWEDTDIPEDEDKVVYENSVPINERIYVKRIRPSRFRCAVSEACDLNDHDWVGYYDYYYVRTLQNTEGINWPARYSGGSMVGAEYASGFVGSYGSNSEDIWRKLYSSGEIVKVWHIWDNVAHKRLLLLEDYNMHELWSGPSGFAPLVDLRWDLRSAGFYPIPPVFQWLSPQDEINEAREQVRSYRRRFTRKFQYQIGMVEEEEAEKFVSGPDGILIQVKQLDAIKAIDNPEMGPTSENALVLAKDDFNTISGTSAEARGQNADRETATQAKLVDQRAQIRESAEQLDFSSFLCEVGRQILVTAQERMTEGLWIKATQNPGPPEQAGQFVQQVQPIYEYVTSQKINDGYDYEVEFDVQNATPAAMQAAQQSFVAFMSLLAQFPMISMSPTLIREAAFRVGYRNEEIIKQAQQVAQVQAQAQAQQIAQPSGGAPGANGANTAKAKSAQMATPPAAQVESQIQNQLT